MGQLDLWDMPPEEQIPVAQAPLVLAACTGEDLPQEDVEAVRSWLLEWGAAHGWPGFAFPFGHWPPHNDDPDRRFGCMYAGKSGWYMAIGHGAVEEWIVKCLAHVQRFDSGSCRIPIQRAGGDDPETEA